jgi:hypothetical protein
MFDNTPAANITDEGLDESRTYALIETILSSSNLPPIVKEAPAFQIFKRRIDAYELDRLTQVNGPEEDDPAKTERLKIRRKALSAYLDCNLTCALIRIPGTIYTVEIDPDLMKVVYWECC